ncbi:MAG TPA: gliding motility-associated C-terminal domain-containing protein [Chitinophagales bacterium]|nr:gliding motility-associated C-terminal domain-containing protein [Chitinophagales bacterium]
MQADAQAFVIPQANNNNAMQLSCSCYQLTIDSFYKHGAIWNQNPIDLNNPFDFSFRLFLGSNNGTGADGIVFVIQNQNNGIPPSTGGGMGYQNFVGKSLGIEYDTHSNPPAGSCDISQEHIAIDTQGYLCPNLAGPVPMLASGANADDGAWHTTEIVWDPGTQTMTIYFDGSQRLTYTFSTGLVNSIFGGQNSLYWGWTGATGGQYNVQKVCAYFYSDYVVGTNFIHCGADTVTFTSTSQSGLNNIIGYQWDFDDNGATSNQQTPQHTFSSPGTYNVSLVVTDQTLCTDTMHHSVRIDQPAMDTASTGVTCYGGNDGSAVVTATSGIAPYSFTWSSNVSSTNIATGLTQGIYNVTFTDSAMCSVSTSFNIGQPTQITVAETQVDVKCYGQATGSISLTTSGGIPGYGYTWNPNISNSSSATTLVASTYHITVTDASHCTVTETYIINQPPQLTLAAVATPVTCFGLSDGVVTATATGGVPNYSFSAMGGGGNYSSGSGQFNNLAANVYNITVTDQNACTATATATVTQPTVLASSETHTDVLCNGLSTGSVLVAATGGTPAYSYSWNPNVSGAASANNIPAGNYSITVTDNNGCSLIQTATITQPPAIVFNSTATPVSCYGLTDGTITSSATGGVPGYDFSAVLGSASLNSQTGQFNNLAPGAYDVYVTDQNACVDTGTITVAEPPQLTDVIATAMPSCYGYTNGKVVVVAGGGTPGFSYHFSNGASNTSGIDGNVPAGNYTVTITDASGCSITDSAMVDQPEEVIVEVAPLPADVKLGQSLQLTTTNNQTEIVTYDWQPQFGLSCYDCPDPLFSGVYSQPYTVTITNEDSCSGHLTFNINVIPDYNIFFPSAFSPNNDGNNDLWQLFGNLLTIKQLEIMIFDRVGEKVFESNDINFMWDGTYKGQPAPEGVYTYVAKLVWLNNHSDNKLAGSVTLLR